MLSLSNHEYEFFNNLLEFVMRKLITKLISRFYNEDVEDFCTRLLYFFNTIDSYYFMAGASSFLVHLFYSHSGYPILDFLLISAAVFTIYKTADFYPLFVLLSPAYLFFLLSSSAVSYDAVGFVLLVNLAVFFIIQILFMGFPDSIVARDPTISIRKIWNSIFTIAPTTVSLSMSFFFSSLFSLILICQPGLTEARGVWFWITIAVAALVTLYFKPKSFVSSSFRPAATGKLAEKIIVLNIDGCRLDRLYEAKPPFLTSLQNENTCFPKGLKTVYRALTNPAFASILTGAVPQVHGIKNNNLGQTIKVEGLPDLVKTKLYGSMHVKHFSKPHWDTKIVSLPTHGIYKSDDIMIDWLKRDLLDNGDGARLFVADLSEVDFLGHAYGSESRQYLEAIKRADRRIEQFWEFLRGNCLLENTLVIICSDHGMFRIDHSYLLFAAEMYVPFIIAGPGIKKSNPLGYDASIMDIAPTISYLLGIPYPDNCGGRVFMEALA